MKGIIFQVAGKIEVTIINQLNVTHSTFNDNYWSRQNPIKKIHKYPTLTERFMLVVIFNIYTYMQSNNTCSHFYFQKLFKAYFRQNTAFWQQTASINFDVTSFFIYVHVISDIF